MAKYSLYSILVMQIRFWRAAALAPVLGLCALAGSGSNDGLPEAPVSVLVNQVGYDAREAKILVVQVRDPETGQTPASFELLAKDGKVVFRGSLAPRGRIHAGRPDEWGARYWIGDFTRFAKAGRFRARVRLGPDGTFSLPFRIGERILFRETAVPAARFFYWQRCGFAIPGFHEACHLDDARVPEQQGGGHRDATGGWHDAGDFNKYASIACRSVYALTVLARNSAGLLGDEDRRRVLDEALWGAEFLRKMWQPGKGIIYHDVWNGYGYSGPPKQETDGKPGTKDDRPLRGEGPSGMTAAALAAVAGQSERADYREAAEDLWRGAVRTLGQDIEDPWVSTSGGVPDLGEDVKGRLVRRTADLLLADLELEGLTGSSRYAEGAKQRVESLLGNQRADGLWPSDVYSRTVMQGVPAAALALYAHAHPRNALARQAGDALRRWVERNLALADNPFAITPWEPSVFFNPHVERAWSVGQNSQYLSQAWALYLAGDLLREPRARILATRQIDWVLGVNPLGLCMMEGSGTHNPPAYLHRFAPSRERGAVPGAIPNGIRCPNPREDRPYFDNKNLQRRDYRSTEPWEPHNAFYLLALAARENRR